MFRFPASTLRPGVVDQAREGARSSRIARARRDRLVEPDQRPGRIVSPQGRGDRLGEAEADERVLEAVGDPLLARQPAGHGPPERKRERDVGEHEPRHFLDQVDFARQVARAPGRDAVGAALELAARGARASPPARPLPARARPPGPPSPGGRRRGPAPAGRPARRYGPSSARRSARRATGSRGRQPARPGRDRRPSPSGSIPPCACGMRSPLLQIPTGSKFAASSRTLVVESDTSVSSPPMIPASAIPRSASAIRRSDGSSLRRSPSSVRISSPWPRPPDDDASLAQRGEVEGVEWISRARA